MKHGIQSAPAVNEWDGREEKRGLLDVVASVRIKESHQADIRTSTVSSAGLRPLRSRIARLHSVNDVLYC